MASDTDISDIPSRLSSLCKTEPILCRSNFAKTHTSFALCRVQRLRWRAQTNLELIPFTIATTLANSLDKLEHRRRTPCASGNPQEPQLQVRRAETPAQVLACHNRLSRADHSGDPAKHGTACEKSSVDSLTVLQGLKSRKWNATSCCT